MTGPAEGPLSRETFLERLEAIRQWEANGAKRAPHKPLLVLLALGRVQAGEERLQRFADLEKPLARLLREFGPPWPTTPLYPFWYLRNDRVWEVPEAGQLDTRAGKPEPRITALRATAHGGFPADIDSLLRAEPSLVRQAAELLLDRHFETSLHAAIASACGIDLAEPLVGKKRKRDRAFRAKVLTAYEHRCAACGWNVYLAGEPFGLEAAHVFWHTLGGPDDLTNGLCLCALHHQALDRGIISIGTEGELLVSQQVSGSDGLETIHNLTGKPIRAPQPGNPQIAPKHSAWHREQVFKSPARG